jgi:hypothetical protein
MIECFPALIIHLNGLISAAEQRSIAHQAPTIAAAKAKRKRASERICVTRQVGLTWDRAETSPTDEDWGDRPLMRVLEEAAMELEGAVREMEALEWD